MKLAAIGSGAWGRNIVRTLHHMGALGAVAESHPPLGDQLAADYPSLEIVPCYTELLSRPAIAAVTIATPAPTHHRIAKDCLLAGKDVVSCGLTQRACPADLLQILDAVNAEQTEEDKPTDEPNFCSCPPFFNPFDGLLF